MNETQNAEIRFHRALADRISAIAAYRAAGKPEAGLLDDPSVREANERRVATYAEWQRLIRAAPVATPTPRPERKMGCSACGDDVPSRLTPRGYLCEDCAAEAR